MTTLSAKHWTFLVGLSTILAACGGGGTPIDGGAGGGGGGGGGGGVTGIANVELRSLSYTNNGNWQYRMKLQTAQDDTPDSNNNSARYERYASNNAGSTAAWAFATTPQAAGDLFWNGSQWRTCASGYRETIGPLNAGNERQFNYCDMYATGSETIIEEDVSGQRMDTVISNIKNTAGNDGFIDFANYGPSNLSDLGFANFPTGSIKREIITSVNAYAFRYDGAQTNYVRAYNANLAAGGSSINNPPTTPNPPASNAACDPAGNASIDDLSTEASTLEAIIFAAPGTPCVYKEVTTSAGASVIPHEWWQATTVEFGELQGFDVRPVGTGTYYKQESSMRVAFTGGNSVTFYECLQRTSDGSIRNCFQAGTGTYSIEQLGGSNGRVMTFSGMPVEFDDLPVDRVLIERGGRILPGYREKAGARTEIGFNDTATRALFSQLGILVPEPSN